MVGADGISILNEQVGDREGKGWKVVGADGISILN